MIEVNSQKFKNEILEYEKGVFNNEGVVVIDFYADWCQPCKVLEKQLTDIEQEFKDINFYKVNCEVEYELTEFFKIKNLPTIVMIDSNNQITIETGMINRNVLKEKLKSLR